MEIRGLREVGLTILEKFHIVLAVGTKTPEQAPNLESHCPRLVVEEQKFRIWASSMGLQQQGHASLDYRVRDVALLRDGIARILEEMTGHLENLVAIARNEREPLDEQEGCSEEESGSGSDADDELGSADAEVEPLEEVSFRASSLTECVDALYNLAPKIRNPRNRPQRTMQQLCGRLPEGERQQYIKARQDVEIARLSYYHKERLMQEAKAGNLVNISKASSTSNYLLRRAGIANARRKEQFMYWEAHATKLAHDPSLQKISVGSEYLADKGAARSEIGPDHSPVVSSQLGPQARSLATSATPIPLKEDSTGDIRSYISRSSRAPLAAEDGSLGWPAPPAHAHGARFFVCPYCRILCPGKYLQGKAWM